MNKYVFYGELFDTIIELIVRISIIAVCIKYVIQ